ncbi:MAG: hypothetical protein ACYS26_06475, partial [Planctomycetota bacterium]
MTDSSEPPVPSRSADPSRSAAPGDGRTLYGMPLSEATYAALSTAFCVVLVLTNIIGTKLFEVFPDGRPG